MISKTLKVGDKFTDGSFLYEVLSLTDTPGIYVSKIIGSAKDVKPTKTVKEDKPIESTDYESMAYADLKALAKEKSVSAKGSKEEVIERLKAL